MLVNVKEETLIIIPFKTTAFLLWRKEYPLLLFSSEDTVVCIACKNIFAVTLSANEHMKDHNYNYLNCRARNG